MGLVHLDDGGDPRLAAYRNVPDPELLRERRLFVAEGRLVVRTLLTRSSFAARSVLVTAAALESLSDLAARRDDLPWYVVSRAVMNSVAGFNIHRGCLALGERPPPCPVEALLEGEGAGRLVVLEEVTNADNVGGIFRCAAAFAARGIVLGPGCCDPLYRKAIRTSIGASLSVPFAVTPDWPGALEGIRSRGYRLVALTPAGDAPPLGQLAEDLRRGNRIAVMAGSEGTGLTEQALARADLTARIPIAADVDSLNVAVAVGIALYQLTPASSG